MSGDLNFSHDDASLTFEGSGSKINTAAGKELTFGAGGTELIHAKDNLLTFQNANAVFTTTDGRQLLTVDSGAASRINAYASYFGKIEVGDNLVNKRYVDDRDNAVIELVDLLEVKVDNLDLGILEVDADAKYLQEIKVRNTSDLPYGDPARVEVFNKNEFDFYIPSGPKGEKGMNGYTGTKGQPGIKGEKGPDGVNGQKGDKGEIGEKGAPSVKGDKGVKGQKGEVGLKGEKGSGGTYVVRGNTGSTMRIWYSSGKYYIAGTS